MVIGLGTAAGRVASSEECFGGVEILLDTGGIARRKAFWETTESEYTSSQGITWKSKCFIAQEAARVMKQHRVSAIVYADSMWALMAVGTRPSRARSPANAREPALELPLLKIRRRRAPLSMKRVSTWKGLSGNRRLFTHFLRLGAMVCPWASGSRHYSSLHPKLPGLQDPCSL